MIPKGRLAARLLLRLFFLCIASPCLADVQSDRRDCQASSNFDIVTQWFRFTAPETFQATKMLVGKAEATVSQFRRQRVLQQDWIQEKLRFVAERCSVNLGQFASTWLPHTESSNAVQVDMFLDAEGSVLGLESAESAYWTYYQDCDRWGVELTRAIPRQQDVNVSAKVEATDVRIETASLSSIGRDGNLAAVLEAWSQTTQWIGHALKYIEFAAIESPVSSGRAISTLTHQ